MGVLLTCMWVKGLGDFCMVSCRVQVECLSSSSIALPSQSTGWSALFFAVNERDVATTKRLLAAGANVFLKDKVCFNFLCTQFCVLF